MLLLSHLINIYELLLNLMSYNKNIEKASIIFTFFLLCLVARVSSLFCSAFCKPNFCTGINSNQCTACDAPFALQTNATCLVDPATGYAFAANQSDITINLGGSDNCGPYNYRGRFSAPDNLILRTQNPITIPHYAVRLIVWVIARD